MNRALPTVFRRGLSVADLKPLPEDVSASKIRKTFLDFFCQENGHYHIASSPVFSLVDPTLAFVNAGMNQFKDVFLGLVQPAANRVANSQKCIRIGGKHNDLMQVGRDGTHHSFFEMLGNWSFGDYFKKEACTMSWNLLTNVYNIPPERLYVTYFKGDEVLGLGPDLEVKEIWKELGVEESHILGFGMEENFWEMGNTGPCGACTEIHYDHIQNRRDAGNLVNSGTTDVSELWNLVFTQYNRKEDGSLEMLNRHFVDTGMGFERLVAILQGKKSNYDTDLFLPLFEVIKKCSRHSGYTGSYGNNEIDSAYRILADHGRMIAVALSDGMIPNHQNKVRTIIRRALNICEDTFGCKHQLLTEVIKKSVDLLSEGYPQMGENISKLEYIINREHEALKALQTHAVNSWKKIKFKYPGITKKDVMEAPSLIDGLEYMRKTSMNETLTPQIAWTMFETLGIPLEKTVKLASVVGFKFDVASYENFVKNQKESTKKTQEQKFFNLSKNVIPTEVATKLLDLNLNPTNDSFKYEYIANDSGQYVFPEQEATIEAIICDNALLDRLTPKVLKEHNGCQIGFVLDRTNLSCSERNRQCDKGSLFIGKNVVFNVENVVRFRDLIIHFGTFKSFPSEAEVTVNSSGFLRVDEERRLQLMMNHTALNLLKAAFRDVVPVCGEKQSMVGPDELNLNLMVYKERIEIETLKEIELFVNRILRHDVGVARRPLTHEQFNSLRGVVVFPGTQLLGPEIPVFQVDSGFNLIREHCSGTHVLRTSHVHDFVLTDFHKVAYSVKGFKGVTGERAKVCKENGAKLRAEWVELKEAIEKSADFKAYQSKLKDFRNKVVNCTEISHVTKLEIVNDYDKMNQKIKKNSAKKS